MRQLYNNANHSTVVPLSQYTTSARVLVQAYHDAWPDLSFVGKMMARVTVVRVLTARLLVRCTLSTMPSK